MSIEHSTERTKIMKQAYELNGYTLEDIQDLFKVYSSYRKSYEKKWSIVKKFHDGDMERSR